MRLNKSGLVLGGRLLQIPWRLAAAVLTLSACAVESTPALLEPGAGSFVFNDSLGNRDLPIIVHYYMPAVPNTDTPIVIVMPGASRDGPRYHSDWVPEAERYGFLLLVPEFGIDHYPGSAMYNLGNMFTEEQGGDPVDESMWTFTAIEHLIEST